MTKLKVGVLGATGTVGQRMIQLLERHPWFEVSAVAASDNSAGKNYAQVTRWLLETPLPEAVAKMTVQSCQPGLDCDFALSGLPSSVAEETELQLAKAGMPVLSNASPHRMRADVPRLDRDRGQGMTVVVGPIIPCAVLDYKFRLLSHNTIRGAAGAAILNAELMYRKGLIG
jgi:aspartate-semialdehyde dehydrogenase